MQQNRDMATLSIINETPTFLEGPSLLHELVPQASDAPALDFLENGSSRREISYRRLHVLSDVFAERITRALAELKHAPAIIPVLLPQSPELYITLLAILKAGKAFCPISLDAPVERIQFILQDVSASVFITSTSAGAGVASHIGCTAILVDHDFNWNLDTFEYSPALVSKSDLAYVLYTSGSTGVPKGVGVSHRAVTQSLLAHDCYIPEFTRFLQFAAPTFDVSIFEIFFPWYRGKTLVGCERTRMLNDLPGIIHDLRVDAAELTPTVVNNLLGGRSSVPSLRLLLTIGEMLTENIVFEYGGTDTRESILWGMYGPTEAAIHCTVQPQFSANSPASTIGFPLSTVSAFVIAINRDADVNTSFEVLPRGQEGELVLGGPQLAECYLNRPEANAAAFIQHPSYGYLYRTGDRAKIREDGIIECLGRVVTGQVKLRGQRVELGEIEHTIMRSSTCRAVTAMVIENNLVAFCAIVSVQTSPETILDICKQSLPAFMVPSEVVVVENMPQLASGKVDRAALKNMHRQASQSVEAQSEEPERPGRHIVHAVMEERLNRTLESDSNLALAGLNSLQSIQVASALRKHRFDVSATDVLTTATVGELISLCDNRLQQAQTPDQVLSLPRGSPGAVPEELDHWKNDIALIQPCSPIQEAMLAETIARPVAYCNWIEVELAEHHTFEEIETAVHKLAEANEILRSGFYTSLSDTGKFVQIVWKALISSQLQQVDEFQKQYSLDSSESLLRPLRIQVQISSSQPRLLFQIHHAVYDGWSFDLLLQDLGNFLRGNTPTKRPQFQDVVSYYDQLDDGRRALDEEYWKNTLSDRAVTSLANYNGRVVESASTCSWSGRSTVPIGALLASARDLMVSPQVFFQAATAFVLSLYTQSLDVILGNVTSGRTIPVTGIEDIIGPCVSSLPFRLRLDKLPTVREVLQESHNTNMASLQHSTLSLREIARAIGTPPRTRLFDVLFVWQQSVFTPSGSSTSSPVAYIVDSADDLEFKITLEFEPRADHISLKATYDPSAIPEAQLSCLSRQIDEVVLFFLNHIDIATTEISKFFSEESLSIANPHPQHCPILHGPSHAVEKWASVTPEKEAIVFGHIVNNSMEVKETITYDQLNRRANMLAHTLVQQGVGQGGLVGVIAEKSVDLYIAILAILKSGCGYLPLVPDLPIDRIRTILSDAAVSVCITDALTRQHLERSEITVSFMSIEDIDPSSSDENLGLTYNGSHLAYAVFTSGSTGVPKGVLVTQENLMSNLTYLSSQYPRSVDSKLLQACSQAFDVSVFEIFFTWHVGMCLCTAAKDDLFQDLEGAINKLGVTHLSLTPTVAALIDPDNVPRVEFLVTAGEAVTEYVRRKWAGRGLWQGYGPSETTNICTIKPKVTPGDLINNIGKAFTNTSTFVLDPNSETILPRGAIGELCFGGSQVFRGYLNRPELNSTKIITHPSYGRLYRSGDLGLLLPDDQILFTGRLDDQVKVRGQRVELGEITSAILDQEGVHDCATLLSTHKTAANVLISFWVPSAGATQEFAYLSTRYLRSSIIALFASLSQRLPAYMVPNHLIPVTKLPMTAQGKIDKRSLQACVDALTPEELDYASHASDDCDQEEVLDGWEKQVAIALADTIGNISAATIKRNSSFYGLGLDSISAIHVTNRLKKANLGFFTVSTLLKHPTIKALAELRKSTSIPQPPRPPKDIAQVFQPEDISKIQHVFSSQNIQYSKILPCTPLQEAMLTSAEDSTGASYNNLMIFDVRGSIEILQECWNLMVQRHDILRTAFVATDNASCSFAQVVLKDATVHWGNLESLDGLEQICYKQMVELLGSHKPPLWLAIIRTVEKTQMVFSCHHALYDAIAISNLQTEIQEAYNGRSLPSPDSPERYLQHVVSQDFSQADKFWEEALHSLEPTYFPDLTGTSSKPPVASESHAKSLAISLHEAKSACQRENISMLALVQASWAKLLHFYTGEHDFCFGNVVSGRNFTGEDFSRLVAPCFNTIPVRCKFDHAKTNNGLLKEIHDFNTSSLDYQLTPLRRIQNLILKDGRRLFDTMVILQQPVKKLDSSIWQILSDVSDMDVPVVCEISQDEDVGALQFVLHYHNSIISADEASIMADTFEATLVSMVRKPYACVAEPSAPSPELWAIQDTNLEAMRLDTFLLHTQFERNASVRPDHIALDWLHTDGSRTQWSFDSLNKKANSVSHTLLGHGAKPEDIIPIHMVKSPLFYACVLGVLKAGAAFSPVLPDLPDSRKMLMLEDLSAKFLLCADDAPIGGDTDNLIVINVTNIDDVFSSNPNVPDLKSSNLAYCIFTSGSTGMPKAVSMEHRSPLHTIESSRSLIPWSESSRLLQFAAISFDMCYYDCFLAWTYGFTLCAAEQQLMLNELPMVINTLGTNLLDLTPSVAASLSRSEVPRVDWLYCIGEALSTEVVEEWGSACVNSYGPTEAAFCTTIYPVSRGTKSSIIGKPFPSTSFAVFTADGKWPLPRLAVGELFIGGAQLARSYHKRSELTEERFVFKHGQRYYRSGDIVRMLSDGNFEFIGRADDQVKIRGLRVELGEISHVLRASHPEVASVVTQVYKKSKNAKEQLVAFILLRDRMATSEQEAIRTELRQYGKEHLPSYMIPQFFLFVERIPKSVAGKVDKKALDLLFEKSETDELLNGTSVHPIVHNWTSAQTEIREIFSRLARVAVDQVSPTVSIYQLGLDSINAVQIAAALRKNGHNVKAADVMKYTNCVDLASFMGRSSQADYEMPTHYDFSAFEYSYRESVLAACNIPAEDVEAIRPCSPLQIGMLSQFLSKDGEVYLNHLRLKLEEDIDLELLERAWACAVSAHVMLRTGFFQTKQKTDPFVMIHYKQQNATLPWTFEENAQQEDLNNWLSSVRCSALHQLHRPMWRIRILPDQGAFYLDFVMLHALFDAWSLQSILADVASAYTGSRLQPRASLDPVIGGIIHQAKDENRQAKAFWASLKDQAQTTRFPNLAPLKIAPQPPAVCSYVSELTLGDFETGCRAKNTTLQVAGVTSWLFLLSALSGEKSVTCGLVLSGRSFEAAESAVFPCITTVPVPYTFTPDQHVSLADLTYLCAEIQAHQHTPLSSIQKIMGHRNETLFDTIFAFQKLPDVGIARHPWTVIAETASVEYPVSIELEPRENSLHYNLTFPPHMVPREHANLLLQQLDHKLQDFLGLGRNHYDTDSILYSMTLPKEPTLPSSVQLLHGIVEHTATLHPHRSALEFVSSIQEIHNSKKIWTYSELDAQGNKVAHLLIHYGAQPGDLVGICFDKCPEASFAILGILKAGCAFVAIDPSAPSNRQAYILSDCRASAVISKQAQSSSFCAAVDMPVLNLDQIVLDSYSSERPVLKRQIDPQDRSYCLYTSGTTGTPKGCEITHENTIQALVAFQRLFSGHWNAGSRWLQFASFHFDVSILEQFWSWSVGICVISAPRDVIFEDLQNSINTLQITHIDLTPSLAQLLHPEDVPTLCKGVFITGGESLKQEILDAWGPTSVIYNGYGPTEATIGCTMYPRVPANGKPSNIGQQFDNVGTLVLEPGTDIPVLRGAIGELCVFGKLVGRGYLNRDDLTARSFPYLKRFNQRIYRTGDLVRILHNGDFEFLGRADDQVKLRGQRLEIGEINSVIKQSSKRITDVATLVLKHSNRQKEQLVTFIVARTWNKNETRVALDDLVEMETAKHACQARLPPYMVPAHFVPLTSLPLSINNKADVKRLKQLFEALSISDLQRLSKFSEELGHNDWTWEEKRLRKIVRDELSLNGMEISRDSSFFELGMDSITVMSVVRAMKQAGFEVTVSLVMKHSTFRRLAKAISGDTPIPRNETSLLATRQSITALCHRNRRAIIRALQITSSQLEALAPCTPIQQGIIAKSLESGAGLYWNTFLLELSNSVNHNRLRTAWNEVHASTQILRTLFMETEDGHMQIVLADKALPWSEEILDETESFEGGLKQSRRKWLHQNQDGFTHPFQLSYISTGSTKYLAVHIFHGLYDGISIDLIFRAVWNRYKGQASDANAPSFHTALAHGPLREAGEARSFWQDHLREGNTQALNLPIAVKTETGYVQAIKEFDTSDTLEQVRRKLNVTAQAIAQACWVKVLGNYCKSSTTIGVVVSGRNIDFPDADRVIGPMFNTLPYRHHHRRRETWAALVKRVHNFNITAHPYQHTALRDIIKWCSIDPKRPLFEALFVYQIEQESSDWAENETWKIHDTETTADYPIAIEVQQQPNNRLKVTLVTQPSVFDTRSLDDMMDQYGQALYEALFNPEAVVSHDATFIADNSGQTQLDKPVTNGCHTPLVFDWTPMAIAIRQAMAELGGVDVDTIKPSTSIFELGLDSVDAIKLAFKIKKQGFNLPVSGIMRGLTIERMLPDVLQKQGSVVAANSLDVQFQTLKHQYMLYWRESDKYLSEVENVLPLTPLQEAMVADMVASDFRRYYNFDVLELNEHTDIKRLQEAWGAVVAASPILRSSFIEIDDPALKSPFAQVVHIQPHEFWSETTINTEPDFPSIFEELRQKASQASFTVPSFNILLISTSEHCYIVLALAHALYDGWSLNLLHDDVKRAYSSTLTARPDYQTTLARIVTTPHADTVSFWSDLLADARPSRLPRISHNMSQEIQSVHRREYKSMLTTDQISTFAKGKNVSLQTLGQTAFALAIAYYTRSLDVTFGAVLSGRDDEVSSQILFPTMNTVAARAIIHGTRDEFLNYMQEMFRRIKEHQNFPLSKAMALVQSHGPLFESLFIYQKMNHIQTDDLKPLYSSIQGQSDVDFPVCVEMETVESEVYWRCAAKDIVLTDRDAHDLLKRIDQVLLEIVTYPEKMVVQFIGQGISVCGLPPFEEDQKNTAECENNWTCNSTQGYQASSKTIEVIRSAIATVSGVPQEEITDDMTIFHVGIDSISAIKVTSFLRKEGLSLSVSEMLRAGSIMQMAYTIDTHSAQNFDGGLNSRNPKQNGSSDMDYRSILRDLDRPEFSSRQGDFSPAHALQQYMVSMWLKTGGIAFYAKFNYKIVGAIDLEQIMAAWKSLVIANPILRSHFVATNDKRIPLLRFVEASGSDPAHVIDISGESSIEQTEIIRNASRSQPWVHAFISRSSSGWDLQIQIHHAMYDAVSLPILIQQLEDLCNNKPAPASNDSFDAFISHCYNPPQILNRKAFWQRYLANIEQHRLAQPADLATTRIEIFEPHIRSSEMLLETARQSGLSIQAFFFAATAKTYAKLTGIANIQDVVLGCYLANRYLDIEDIAKSTSPTMNLIPLRISAPLQQDLVAIATQIQLDLASIRNGTNAFASLYEISEWTDVKIDVFVNFLSHVEVGERGKKEVQHDGIKITQLSQRNDPRSVVMDYANEAFGAADEAVMATLANEDTSYAYLVSNGGPNLRRSELRIYQHPVDIEATVRDGGLDVGVFALESMMSLADGKNLIDDLMCQLDTGDRPQHHASDALYHVKTG